MQADIRSTQSPYQDGSSVVAVQMPNRLVTLTGTVMAGSREEMYELRRRLSRVLNPKLGAGRLVYENDYRSYAADAIPDEAPVFTNRFSNHHGFTASFTCPDPFWRDVEEATKDLKSLTGGLTFPLKLGTRFALIGYRGVFENEGDVETPIRIRYTGPAVNPVVENETTGEYIKINTTLAATDVLEITTAFGRKRVEVVAADGSRTNVFHWIDLGSTFFGLQPGENILKYSSDNAEDDISTVTVYWNNRYGGA
ncbi:hypothetical protein J2Z45_000135 [Cohnella lubricantis]|nr:hypothetical protein [Cohnella lubricantis]